MKNIKGQELIAKLQDKPSKTSLLERQTEAAERMADTLDKILMYVKPTWAKEAEIRRYEAENGTK